MFKIADDYVYTWPVTIRKPVDGGKFQEETFTAKFKFLDQDKIDELTGKDSDVLIESLSAVNNDIKFLKECFVGWGDDVHGDDDKPLSYSEATRDRLIKIRYVRLPLLRAYFDSASGIATKN
ncbi:MAG: hypothetical protein HQ494_08890 [Rhodospirillales bacterium]|nr:hypothetical protein [Rhodospirillales bacterium]